MFKSGRGQLPKAEPHPLAFCGDSRLHVPPDAYGRERLKR
jgi:hypothetical protein